MDYKEVTMAKSGWKRGARPGNYTPMQWNIACRVKNMGMPNGQFAYTSPNKCPTVRQAEISLGGLPYGTCGAGTVGPSSPCAGVSGAGGAGASSRRAIKFFSR